MKDRILDFGVFSFYKDLTVGDIAKIDPLPPEREYETIVLQSKINEMRGMGDYIPKVILRNGVRFKAKNTARLSDY